MSEKDVLSNWKLTKTSDGYYRLIGYSKKNKTDVITSHIDMYLSKTNVVGTRNTLYTLVPPATPDQEKELNDAINKNWIKHLEKKYKTK